MLYLYAIAESDDVPSTAGLREQPLRAIGQEGMFAIASEHDELRLEPNEDDMWSHESVVEELMNAGSVLPMRFGSAVADEATVRSLLGERRPALEQALDRVRGAVELSVRVAITADSDSRSDDVERDPNAGPGTAYLLGRLQRERHVHATTRRIDERLGPLARASTAWSGGSRSLWKAAYLVSDDRVEAFTEEAELLDDQLSGTAVLCTGPWPPYSFSARGGQG